MSRNVIRWMSAAAIGLLATGAAMARADEPAPAQVAATEEHPMHPPGGPQPKFEIDATEFDFGTVWQGEPAQRTFKVRNAGKADLTISVKSSCGCTVAEKPKSPLKPDEETSFAISYNTKKRKGQANQTITITTNDPERKVTQIRVHGEVKELVKMEPPDGVFFGQLYENSKTSKTVKLTPQTTEELKLRLKPGQDFGMYTVELKEITPGKQYELIASTNPPLEVNSPKARIEVQIETGLEKMPEMPVVIQSVVVPPVQIRPTRLYVPKSLSTKMTRSIRIQYLPEEPLKITEVKTSHPNVVKAEIAPETPMPAGSTIAYREVMVTIEAGAELPASDAEVSIKTDSKDSRFAEIKIPVRSVSNQPGQGSGGIDPNATGAKKPD
jgi:hypothetical protein